MKNRILFLILIAVLLFGFSFVSAKNLDTGWHSPASEGENYDFWTDKQNAYVSDDTYATVSPINSSGSWETFGFEIPTGAIILGIEITAEAKYIATSSEIRYYVYSASSDVEKLKTTYWEIVETEYPLGGATDLWETTWISSDFNDDNFYIFLMNRTAGTHSLDHIQVKVYYSHYNYLDVNATTVANVIGYIGKLFSDISVFIWLAIGLPLGFWVIRKTVGLVRKRIR